MPQLLEQRVIQLEKNLRFYRFGFAALVIAIAGFAFMSFDNKAAVPDLIQAKAFQVVDNNGKVLVDINKEDNNGQISTFTPYGKKLFSVFTTDDGAGGINTFDKTGHVIFKVTNTEGGGGYLALFNAEGKEVGEIGVTNIQSGYMRLNDHEANKMISMTYTQEGGGYVSLSNEGKEMIRMSTPDAGGRLGIYNGSATRVVYAGAQDTKDGNITIYNNAGTRTGGVPNQ